MNGKALFCAASAACLLMAGLASPAWSASAQASSAKQPGSAASAPKRANTVEPAARAALSRMGAYLRTLQAFEVTANTTLDEVTDEGQKLQFGGTNTYRFKRPDGFMIQTSTDRQVREIYYDGKALTIFAPRMGFYVSVPAPPTIRQTLDAAKDKYGVELPLEDLFRWGTADDRHPDLKSGYEVGYAKIDGVDTDQYAFSEDGFDWQIWIQRGDQALPRKVVITTTFEAAQPQYVAVLNWKVNPTFEAATFVFKPPPDAKPITIASVKP